MRIGGENRPAWFLPRHWMKLADSPSVKEGLVFDVLSYMAGAVQSKAGAAASAFRESPGGVDILEGILKGIHVSASRLGMQGSLPDAVPQVNDFQIGIAVEDYRLRS